MKSRLLIIIGIVITGSITALTIGTMEYQSVYNQNCNSDGGYVVGFLRCTYINEDFELPDIMKKARDLGIDNVMNAVDSEELSFDEKREYIKFTYEESPDIIPSLNIRIRDFTRNLEYGEQPTFTVIETGYAYACTSPKLEVYHLKGETGHDLKNDELIYEEQITHPCPEPDDYSPILKFWDEGDFRSFPACEKEGRYLVVGDSGYERTALEEYYCNAPNED